jgi:fatty-acyl-CoA synthase
MVMGLKGNEGAAIDSVWLPGGEPNPGRIARARLRKPEDIHEIEAFQPEALLPERTLYGAIRLAASEAPDKAAIKHLVAIDPMVPPRVISYAALVDAIERAANLFHAKSDGERTSVAIILPMAPEAFIVTWAAATAGIAAPINPFLEFKHIVAIMNAARATVLVIGSAKHGAGAWDKLHEIRARVPTLKAVYVLDSDNPEDDLSQALERAPGGGLKFADGNDPYADAFYLPTGGTTAAPKLVRMTHFGQILNAWNIGALMGAGSDEVVGHALPLFHVGGLVTIGLRAMIYGQTLVTLTSAGFRDPAVIRNFWALTSQHGVTTIVVTPTTAAALVATDEALPPNRKLKSFHCGGSTVPLEISRAFHAKFGVWLRESWGMSEVYGVVTGHPDDGAPPVAGSVGYVLPYYRLKPIEVDDTNRHLRDCAAGERGVLVIGGAGVVPGYVSQELDSSFYIRGMPDGGAWANTGDLGMVDANGRAWLFGRAKDLIIRGGHNIDPWLVEEVLANHPAVQLSAAIGRPDPQKGEMPMAYVQLKPGMSATAEELISFCRENVQEQAAAPVEIVIVDQMPVTPVGKVFKPTLRLDAMCRIAERVAAAIVGPTGTVQVSVDETGARPRAIIAVTGNADVKPRLDAAFAGYGFAMTVTVES